MFTVSQAAERLGVKPNTVRSWVWRRKIDYVKVGKCVRISEEAIQRLIADNTVRASRKEAL